MSSVEICMGKCGRFEEKGRIVDQRKPISVQIFDHSKPIIIPEGASHLKVEGRTAKFAGSDIFNQTGYRIPENAIAVYFPGYDSLRGNGPPQFEYSMEVR